MQKEKHRNKIFIRQSLYRRWLQCPLYFYYSYFEKKSAQTFSESELNKKITVFNEAQVREVAYLFFDAHRKFSRHLPFLGEQEILQAAKDTAHKISAGEEKIFAAVFYNGYAYCRIDVLEKTASGWRAYKIKSTAGFNPQQKSEVAYCYFVLQSCGLPVEDIFLTGIDSRYTRESELQPAKLLRSESVLEFCQTELAQVKRNIKKILRNILQKRKPNVAIGAFCKYPHPCSFRHLCWQHVPAHSVFELSGMDENTKFTIYKNFSTIGELDVSAEFLNHRQRLQVTCEQNQKEHTQRKELQEFLRQFVHPIYFIDFESFVLAVPPYPNTRPYESIPFQFSLHILHEDNLLEHKEFLFAKENFSRDPREEFISALLRYCKQPSKDWQNSKGSIVAYGAGFEKRMLQKLGEVFSRYKEPLYSLHERFLDLAIPFEQGYYYHPQMQGSFSIKKILPVVNPNMSYKHLSIQNGGEAMLAYLSLFSEKDIKRKKEIYQNLLEYCALDSLAMVEIYRFLQKQIT